MSTPTIIVADDFHPDPDGLRKTVLQQAFHDVVGPDQITYTGCCQEAQPDLLESISSLYGGRKIENKLSGYRLALKGDLPPTFCHADSICAKYAGVLYLNDPHQCQGGTAFWRHRLTGMDRLPSAEALKVAQHDPDTYYQTITEFTRDERQWQQVGFIGMKFNRFVTYPSKLFHSRWPVDGFGRDLSSGRLIWVIFFDVVL